MDGKDQSDRKRNRRRKIPAPERGEREQADAAVKNQIRHVPAHGMEPKEPEIDDLPGGERRAPIIARDYRAVAFERPHVGSERLPDQSVVLDQGVLNNLPRVVIDELAAQRIGEYENADRDQGKRP